MISRIYNKFRRITSTQLYFPEIDGIRFVAIVLVVLFHTHGYFAGKSLLFSDDERHTGWLNTLLENGDRGVELFFVLSGFILCLPFAQQYISNGKKISLKKYYLRRVTRLEPPYIIAMTLFLLLQAVMHIHPAGVLVHSWLASLVYAHAIIYHHAPLLTVVAWSLEIEIQFYLLAPFVFRVLALKPLTRRLILFLLIVLITGLQSSYTPPFRNIYLYAQYFLTGILLADFYVSDTLASFFNKKSIAGLAGLCLAAICFLPFREAASHPAFLFVLKLAFPLLIGLFYYMVMKNEVVKRVFSYKFIPIIGGMCYSIYLVHYTVISMIGRLSLHLHFTNYYLPNLLLQAALMGAAILAISSVFYYYIERPFMSRKWMDMLMRKGNKKGPDEQQSV